MTDVQIRPTTAQPAAGGASARPGLLLGLVLTGQFMAVLDVSVVNVAVPTIRTDLHASGAALQLVIAGYTIAYAVLLITGARLGARYGYSRLFQYGLTGFSAASLACGLAPTTGSLIAFRLLQGVGAAVMVPQVMSLVQRTFTGAARARALGLYSAVVAGGVAVGQVVGGVLISADLFGTGWRPVFLVNVPIGLVLLLFSRRLLPVLPGDGSRRFDLVGLVVLAAAIGTLVVPLVLGHELGWPVWGWVMLAVSGLLFALFGLHPSLPMLGLAVLAPAYLVFGLLMSGGGELGFGNEALLGLAGLAAGCAYSPLFGRALGRVDQADAADGTGVLVTVIQLGQVLGVALLGSVFLGQVSFPAPARTSGTALLVTCGAIAVAFVLAALFAHRTRRAAG